MAKLFNKIRKQLVSEKPSANRTSNYLKYAIGEIVLVVVGILIALSINNWNEQRKSRITELTYLENIKADLLLNLSSLETFIKTRKESIKSASIVLQYFEKEKPIDYNDFNYHSLTVMVWFPFEQNDNTYQELMNSGKFSILSNKEIKNKLQNMQSSFKRVAFVENEMQQDFESYLYDPFFSIADMNSALKNFEAQVINATNIKELNTTQINELLDNQKFKNGFVLSSYNSDLLIAEYSNMVETTNELILLINKEIDKNN
jgi:hypothetical protein